MILTPNTQTDLLGFDEELNNFVELFNKNKLPNKILLSGQKGIGKCTLAYHLINFVLSKGEEFSYNLNNLSINAENRSFKLIINGSNPNFNLIDVAPEKKSIYIGQIRALINNLNKSSFSSKPRFILIDNIELLNLNSVNALLKVLEEPNDNIFFILINNNKKVKSTLLSRCLNFKMTLTNKKILEISNILLKENIYNLINKDLINYYHTPGKIYTLLKLSKEKNINLKEVDLKKFLSVLIKDSFHKGDSISKDTVYEFLEFYLLQKISVLYTDLYRYFIRRIDDTRKFNLDEDSLFLEINTKLLNE